MPGESAQGFGESSHTCPRAGVRVACVGWGCVPLGVGAQSALVCSVSATTGDTPRIRICACADECVCTGPRAQETEGQ